MQDFILVLSFLENCDKVVEVRTCIHRRGCRLGEDFSSLGGAFSLEYRAYFKEKQRKSGGKRPAQTVFHAYEYRF